MFKEILSKAILYPLKEFNRKIIHFIPKIFIFFTIFIIGFVIAKIVKILALKLFDILDLDKASTRSGFSETLERWGVKESPSVLLSKVICWIILTIFIMIGLTYLDINIVNNLIGKFLIYLPNLIIGIFILICGHLLANFFGRAALIAGVNANIKYATFIGRAVRFVINILAIAMAMEQIGLARSIVISAFSIIFGGVILALSLAFGLAGKDLAKEFLEKSIKENKSREKDDLSHL
jgi:small-conductance mechanosensitive channel